MKMLAVVMLFILFTALAKDAAKPPNSAQISKSAPAIQGNATNKPDNPEQTPLPIPLPVRIIEEPPESDVAKSRTAHASNNEDQDLPAQQRMASAAEYQLKATIVLIILSAIGTVFLIRTVRETRKAADAAWRSVDIAQQAVALARTNGKKQLRAYINISSARIAFQGNLATVHLEFKNFGQTPAWQIVRRYDFSVGDSSWDSAIALEKTMHARKSEYGVMGPTAAMNLQVTLPPLLPGVGTHMDQMGNAFYFWGEISYEDAFDQPQTTWFRCAVRGKEWLTNSDMWICQGGDDAT